VSVSSMYSGISKRNPKIPHGSLPRAGDLAGPGTKARTKLLRPLVGRFRSDAPTFPPDQDLALTCEAALLGEADSLAPAVPEESRADRFHEASLDIREPGPGKAESRAGPRGPRLPRKGLGLARRKQGRKGW
jgi:hypothetical protein